MKALYNEKTYDNYEDLIEALAEQGEIEDIFEWGDNLLESGDLVERIMNTRIEKLRTELWEEYFEGMEIAVQECIEEGIVELLEESEEV